MWRGVDWADVFEIFAALISALATLAVVIGGIRSVAKRTVGRRRAAKRKLYRLAANYQVDFFRATLGAPALRSTKDGLTEWIWIDDLFYVQAVTGNDDSIQRWAVTTRRKTFRPRFVAPGPRLGYMTIKLNASRFATLEPSGLQHVFCSLGARRFWYVEDYYFGNPGNYLTFTAAVNDAAFAVTSPNHSEVATALREPGDPDGALGRMGQGLTSNEALSHGVVREFRASTAPNTYGESSSDPRANCPFGIGPDLDRVRVVERPSRFELWRRERHVRRILATNRGRRT